ncbi:hypothetical protein Tco_0396833 [Tanacetum coccineum]
MPSFCVNPLATSLALNLSMSPSALNLILNTHLLPIGTLPARRVVTLVISELCGWLFSSGGSLGGRAGDGDGNGTECVEKGKVRKSIGSGVEYPTKMLCMFSVDGPLFKLLRTVMVYKFAPMNSECPNLECHSDELVLLCSMVGVTGRLGSVGEMKYRLSQKVSCAILLFWYVKYIMKGDVGIKGDLSISCDFDCLAIWICFDDFSTSSLKTSFGLSLFLLSELLFELDCLCGVNLCEWLVDGLD